MSPTAIKPNHFNVVDDFDSPVFIGFSFLRLIVAAVMTVSFPVMIIFH